MVGTHVLSVVVPAHDEERVLARCLTALVEHVCPDDIEIVVVANGCNDRTADVARAHPSRPTVLELPHGSKHEALNAGDKAVSAMPRLYLDADVVLERGAVIALLSVLEAGQVHVAAPRPRFELAGRPWVVRAYYRTWERLPFLNDEPVGNGVYAVSAEGRRRWGTFPALIADDLYVLRQFSQTERRALPDVHFVVQTPRTLRDLIAVRTRAYLGARQLAEAEVAPDWTTHSPTPSRVGALFHLARGWRDLPDLLSFVCVSGWASARAAWRWRREDTARWDRDVSTR